MIVPQPSAVPAERRTLRAPSKMDLQLNVLRHLPTPIVVLCPTRTCTFANQAAEKLLGSRDRIQSQNSSIQGHGPDALGISLLYNRKWDRVLDKLVAAQQQVVSNGHDGPVHDIDAAVSSSSLSFDDRHFRILVSILTADDGAYFILSFERGTRVMKLLPHSDAHVSSLDGGYSVKPDGKPLSPQADGERDVLRIKKAVFDSSELPGFILTADRKFYLTNKKVRDVLGDVMGGAEGCDGLGLRERLEIWDEHFTRQLATTEFPGMKLVSARQPFTNYRCGFVHVITGDKLVTNVTGECLYDEDTGEFQGGIIWLKDIQEYSDFLSNEQQERLESHETICNLMPHLVWKTTADGQCDWFSDRWYEFTGMTKEESLGEGYLNVIHPDDVHKLLEAWHDHRVSGKECSVEVRYRRHDGIYRWMLARACPKVNEQGNILKWYGTNTDIHDLVMARIDAARNKLQMLTVLGHAEVNLFSIDKDRKITMAEGGMLWDNEADMYDVNDKLTLVGKDAIEISRSTQPGGIPTYEQNVLDILAGKVGIAQSEYTLGNRVFRTRLVADLSHHPEDGGEEPQVQGVLGLSIDVTDMKARQALELDNARLTIKEQAAKDSNKMKSQFLANMSHELRTPTAGVIGMVELLGDDNTLTSEQREFVSSIHLSAKALLTIVNDILDFSKIESGRLDIEKVPFNLSIVVGDLCKLLSMFATQKRLDFIYENYTDENMEVIGDPGRTRQVLSNLLTNALKFTKQGMVKLTATSTILRDRDEDYIQVQFLIEDTGIGIEKSVLDTLFTPFSQGDTSTARLYGGTGLGLTISQNLAKLMDGSIQLESTPNVGSKATFNIPLKVSSCCPDIKRLVLSSSPPNMGFRRPVATRSPSWVEPLAHRSINQDLLNRQISSSVTTSSYVPPSLARHGSIDMTMHLPLSYLSSEQRKEFHILVVEDNPINQTIAIKNIRKLGFPVTAVWNGHEALTYLLSPSVSRPRPSIILMDVQMPVMDGYEATRTLRNDPDYAIKVSVDAADLDSDSMADSKNTEIPNKIIRTGPSRRAENARAQITKLVSVAEAESKQRQKGACLRDIPVIAMTASAIQGDREKCHDAGMDDYLAKPVEKARLEEMLLKWAGRTRDDRMGSG